MRAPFVVTISAADWALLGLDNRTRYKTALSAYYCGHGPLMVRKIMSDRMDSHLCADVRVTAEFMGLSEDDKLLKGV